MNGYAQGFNISGEEIAVFVSAARKAADIMNISISELFGKLESYARAMEAIGAFFDSILNAIRETADNSADIMEEIVIQNKQLYTFGAVHPFDESVDSKIKHYMNLHIKGWKINPHVCGF